MKIQKLKIINISSNGSLNFTHKITKTSTNNYIFSEKDLKNSFYSIKNSTKISSINKENFLIYKNKYIKKNV